MSVAFVKQSTRQSPYPKNKLLQLTAIFFNNHYH